jgi:hypothetical protein
VSGSFDVVLRAVNEALHGQTVTLGALLAPAGITSIVVMNSSAATLRGVQSAPFHPVSNELSATLASQTDLQLELTTPAASIYAVAGEGITTQSLPGSATPTAVLNAGALHGRVAPGATISAALAPASAWALDVNGSATKRSTNGTWYPQYTVPESTKQSLPAVLVLRQFPLNGLIAIFTLGLWAIVWLGFGWIQRLEWLFAARRKRPAGKHVRGQ